MGDHYYGLTDLGRVRDNNEDAFVALQLKGTERVLASVIDGVGGYEGGEVAAAIAKDTIEQLQKARVDDPIEALRTCVHQANQKIIEEKLHHKGKEKMACVLTAAIADTGNNQFYYAHVGDTRMYLLRGESLIKVTKDHSFVGFLEDSSRITEADAMRHPKRNEVNKALGFDPNIQQNTEYIETGSSPFLPGDLLLLCSDGLTDMVGGRTIAEILISNTDLATKARQLIDAANEAGGRDNVTVVLVKNTKERAVHEPTKPSMRMADETSAAASSNTGVSTASRGTPGIVWVLLLVIAGLTAAVIWLYMQKPKTVAPVEATVPPAPAPKQRNSAELAFVNNINSSKGEMIVDSSISGQPVLLTDSVVIGRDSLYIRGNGLVVKRDTVLHGAGFVVPASSSYVFLENMVFEDFPVAIVANNNTLRLSNVRFVNCVVPVSYQLQFPQGAYTRGMINPALFFKTDSLPFNQTKAWQK